MYANSMHIQKRCFNSFFHMKQIALFILSLFLTMAVNGKTGREIIEENGFPKYVTPKLKTDWSQNGAENSLLPMIEEKMQAVTGCGATALAQLMKFWSHPTRGDGFNYYYWNKGMNPQVLFADFQTNGYEWENMLLRYKGNKDVTAEQAATVSRLMADIGVALEMNYTKSEQEGQFYPSTATNIEYIHTVLKKHFKYNPNSRLLRFINGAYTMDEWLTMIYKELSEGRPVLMGARYGSVNHIFVADGYDENGLVHLNLGKPESNSSYNQNTYYDLTQTGITYTADMRMLVEVCPDTMEGELSQVEVSAPGTLKEALGGERESRRICRLKITGSINAEDISWLHELSKETTGQLSYLDLSDCKVENNEIPASAFEGCYALQEIILPDNITKIRSKAFYNCRGLYAVHLPEQLRSWGNYAFTRCRYLEELNIPKTMASMGADPFAFVKLTKLTIDPDNPNYYVKNNAIISKSGNVLLSMPVKTYGDYEIPDGIKEIGESAFNSCEGIRDIYIPATVGSIGNEAFKSCPGLEDFFCYGQTAPSLHDGTFKETKNLQTLHVPAGCRQEYIDKGWTMFQEIIEDLPKLISGDVNQDNTVDISDIVAVINTIAGESTYRKTADVNQDGQTDISDVVSIINIIAEQ